MSEKIRPHRLERKAILYVRQSSAHQVLHNRESSALQYAMRDERCPPKAKVTRSNRVGCASFPLFYSVICARELKLQLRLIPASKQVWWKIVLATDDVGQKLASLRTVSGRICAAAFSDRLRDRPARACVSIPIDTRQIRHGFP
jgi:hypothetical protein